jgi:hypothetical protein
MSYTVSLKNSSKKSELQKQLDDGDIDASTDIYQSSFSSKSHDSTVDNWISSYGIDSSTKSQLEGLKTQSAGKSQKMFRGAIKNGQKVTIFILKFTKEDDDGERDYFEASANVELTSSKEDSKKLINAYFHDLAILALSSGSNSYTLSLE